MSFSMLEHSKYESTGRDTTVRVCAKDWDEAQRIADVSPNEKRILSPTWAI
jgi:hypothetical protein